MKDLSLHILDIAENSITAGAKNIEIIIDEDSKNDLLILEINDDGKGIEKELLKNVTDPFVTTRTTRKVGLGISLLKAAAESAGGKLEVRSEKGKGTNLKAVFGYSHIDRKPIGEIAETLITLFSRSPETDFRYVHKRNGKEFELNTKEIKEGLGTDCMKDENILSELKVLISNKLKEL